jgi:hypothetical protein
MADRKFALWNWSDGMRDIDIEVRMKWGHSNALDTVARGHLPLFYVNLDHQDIHVKGGDLHVLAKTVVEKLEAFYTVEWEQKLAVYVSLPKKDDDDGLAVSLDIKVLSFGIATSGEWFRTPYGRRKDGTMSWSHYSGGFDEAIIRLDGEGGRSRYSRLTHELLGVVDDTPEMQAALVTLGEQLMKMRAMLSELLAGDKLARVLLKGIVPQLGPGS